MWRHKEPWHRPLVAVAIAPLGVVGYLGWVGYRMDVWNGFSKLQDGAWAHKFDYGRHSLDVLTNVAVGRDDYSFAMPFEDMIGAGVVLLVPVLTVLLIQLRPPVVIVVYTVLSYLRVIGTSEIRRASASLGGVSLHGAGTVVIRAAAKNAAGRRPGPA